MTSEVFYPRQPHRLSQCSGSSRGRRSSPTLLTAQTTVWPVPVRSLQQNCSVKGRAPLGELFALVKGTEAAPEIDPAAEKMAIGVRATVSTKIRAWAYLPDPDLHQRPFSVRRFVEDEGSDAWLFLTSRKDQHAFLRPLLSLWCDQAAASILSLPPDLKRRFWVVMDEVASLQELPALTPDGSDCFPCIRSATSVPRPV